MYYIVREGRGYICISVLASQLSMTYDEGHSLNQTLKIIK